MTGKRTRCGVDFQGCGERERRREQRGNSVELVQQSAWEDRRRANGLIVASF